MTKRFGRNRQPQLRRRLPITTLTSESMRLRKDNLEMQQSLDRVGKDNREMLQRLVRVGEELGRFSIMNPNPYTIAVHKDVWSWRIEKGDYNWKTIRDKNAPYDTLRHIALCDARRSSAGYNNLFPFIGNYHHYGSAPNPVVFVPYICDFVMERSTHFAARDVNTGLIVNYAFPTEALFTVPRIDLCRILGERLGEIALQGLYEKFNATTHKEFLEALAVANKDPMSQSHKLSGRGLFK